MPGLEQHKTDRQGRKMQIVENDQLPCSQLKNAVVEPSNWRLRLARPGNLAQGPPPPQSCSRVLALCALLLLTHRSCSSTSVPICFFPFFPFSSIHSFISTIRSLQRLLFTVSILFVDSPFLTSLVQTRPQSRPSVLHFDSFAIASDCINSASTCEYHLSGQRLTCSISLLHCSVLSFDII